MKHFSWQIGKFLEVELLRATNESIELDTTIEEGRLILYDDQCVMRVYIDKELVFSSAE